MFVFFFNILCCGIKINTFIKNAKKNQYKIGWKKKKTVSACTDYKMFVERNYKKFLIKRIWQRIFIV